MDKKQKKYW